MADRRDYDQTAHGRAEPGRLRVGSLGPAGAPGGGSPYQRLRPPRPLPRPVRIEDMRPGVAWSASMHALLALAIVLGLPDFFRHEPPENQPIAVQLINQAEFTRALKRNPHPVKDAKPDTPVEVPSPKPQPPQPQPVPPPPAPPPEQQADATPDVPEPKPQPPTPSPPPPSPTPPPPEPKPPAPPPPPPTPDPKPAPPPPPPKPEDKPSPPPPPPKPEDKPTPPKPAAKPKQEEDFNSLLKNLAKQAEKSDRSDPSVKQQQPPAEETASSQPDAPLGAQLTTSEKDMLVQQIEECWNPPAGAKDAKDLRVQIHIDVGADGSVLNARIVDQGRYGSDPFFRAAAESARRAALNPRCAKLHVPLDKYDQWKSINLFFDPKDMLS
jgi:outer membrane biosynthesis protein TonB